ncbi:uncharacterized protein [Physcomitrium patens]|uniref:uncharacterized protein isoform X3 n=1 Tax=Physcomitrium patens TaxID=3218 RepID=UPI003CCDCBCF
MYPLLMTEEAMVIHMFDYNVHVATFGAYTSVWHVAKMEIEGWHGEFLGQKLICE